MTRQRWASLLIFSGLGSAGHAAVRPWADRQKISLFWQDTVRFLTHRIVTISLPI